MLTTSEICSREDRTPLNPGEFRHCSGSLYAGEPATVLSADVIITAVLFEDGSAEGEVILLDNLARERRSTFRCLEFWIGQLEPSLAAPTPREQLQAMQRVLSAPDMEIPADLRYDPAADRERRTLLLQVTGSLQMPDTAGIKDARAQAIGTVEMLKQRLHGLRTAHEAFPARPGADLTPPASDPMRGWKAIARTTALRLVAAQDAASQMRLTTLFLQNVSSKGITALAFGFGESGVGGRTDCFGSATPVCVLPGASYALSTASASERTLNINAVVFEDGTGDGVQRDIDSINFNRLGRMFETERIRAIVDTADADFATLQARLGGLPQSPQEALLSLEQVKLPGMTLDRIRSADSTALFWFYSGVRNAREGTTRQLPEYQRRTGSSTAALGEVRREVRGLSDQYRAYCERTYASRK